MRAAPAFNDRSGVTESRSFARRFAADICDDRFGHFSIADQLCQLFFLRRTDFTKDDNRLRKRISFEHQRSIGNTNSEYRIATDVRDGRNADTGLS